MRPGAQNGKRPWEPEEEQQLRRLVDAGKSVMLIALRLKRTEQAVRQRLTLLKISLRSKAITRKSLLE
jgi:DNA-binding NarL/FixJ family response regulator